MKKKTNALILRDFFPYRLYSLASHISMSLAKHYENQFGISRAQWRVIAVLGEHDLLSASQVCEYTTMDKVSVSRAVNGLLEKKTLKRQYAKEDRRRSQLSLTKTGYSIYNKIVPIALEYEETILQQLSKKELSNLDVLLGKLEKIELGEF